MKKIVIILAIFSLSIAAYAQNDIQLSQQMFSRITYNPAATGNSDYLQVFAFVRDQWGGFRDAPSTQVFNIHNYFKKAKIGAGLNIVNDKMGVENSLNIKMSYAYHVWFSSKSILSFGVGAGIMYKYFSRGDLQASDQTTIQMEQNKTKPDFNFGLEFNTKRLTIGVSTTHLNQSLENSTNYKVPRHYYFYTKYRFSLSDKVDIIPAISLNSSEFITQKEFNTTAFFSEKFFVGASYRYDEAFVFLAGMNINTWLRLGYSYDMNSGPLQSSSNGSHEISISAKIKAFNTEYHHKTPRFFD